MTKHENSSKNTRSNTRVDELEAALIVLVMTAFLFSDPFRINFRITDLLRLKFFIFTKEPRLLYYTYMYMGSLLAKAAALFLIFALLLAKRENIAASLAIVPVNSKSYSSYMAPFAVFAAALRIYYSLNPLLPNLPIRFVFPDAMFMGNAIIIFSVLFVAPVAEELIFRGYLYGAFAKPLGAYPAIWLVSALFAMVHMPQLKCEILPTFIIFALGFVFSVLRYRTRSVLAPILFHAIYNAVYVSVGAINYFLVGY